MAGAQPHFLLAQSIGQLEPFDPNDSETFSAWYERFRFYCACNNIAEEVDPNVLTRRRTFFLTAVGKRAFSVLYQAALPQSPVQYSIDDLAAVLRQHYENPGLTEANRLKFHQRVQNSSETVFEYVSALQALAAYCDFGEFYGQALKSQLICGIRHADTKAKLLAQPGADFDQAKTTAIQDDVIRLQMKSLAQAHAERGTGLNAMKAWPKKNSQSKSTSKSAPNTKPNDHWNPCYRCGRKHNGTTCPAKDWDCHHCKKKGHVRKMCRQRNKDQQTQSKASTSTKTTIRHLDVDNGNGKSPDAIAEELLSFSF